MTMLPDGIKHRMRQLATADIKLYSGGVVSAHLHQVDHFRVYVRSCKGTNDGIAVDQGELDTRQG